MKDETGGLIFVVEGPGDGLESEARAVDIAGSKAVRRERAGLTMGLERSGAIVGDG